MSIARCDRREDFTRRVDMNRPVDNSDAVIASHKSGLLAKI